MPDHTSLKSRIGLSYVAKILGVVHSLEFLYARTHLSGFLSLLRFSIISASCLVDRIKNIVLDPIDRRHLDMQ